MSDDRQALEARQGQDAARGLIGAADDIAVGGNADAPNTYPMDKTVEVSQAARDAAGRLILDGLDANLERVELWCRAQCPNATIWLHVRQAREILKSGGRAETFKGVTTPDTPLWQADGPEPNIVDRARALIVRVLDNDAIKYAPGGGSYEYLAGMAGKVKDAEAVSIDSYLVVDCVISALQSTTRATQPEAALREAAQAVLDTMSGTYKAGNGREMGIQGDDGEKCWIVHSDQIEDLRAALKDHRHG